MPGIYIHVPFCKKACYYCDFHFSTSLKNKDAFIAALLKEIELRKDYFDPRLSDSESNKTIKDKSINTIYFGGGTPSLLSHRDISTVLNQLAKHFTISTKSEITLEANPDDINPARLKEWKQNAINRLSIGVQSFTDEHLKYMNRAHNSFQGINSIIQSQDAGFNNITIDLIYGFPELSVSQWKNNIETACRLDVPHVSAYCMTIEPKTALNNFIKKGLTKPMDDDHGNQHFEILTNELSNKGYIQYEISNFAKNDFYSKHNSNYWKGEKYLGLGPSAHSFNGDHRHWNISNNSIYIKQINQEKPAIDIEVLSKEQKYNEYILTTLRTIWGTNLNHIKNIFGADLLKHCKKEALVYKNLEQLVEKEEHLYLTEKGKLFADKIASDLFWV